VTDVEALTLRAAAEEIAAGSLSSIQLVEAVLDRIDETEALIQAYAHVMRDSALAAAVRADEEIAQGMTRGPLHGIPIGVKDVFATHDAPTEAGSRVLAGFVPPEDAHAVRRLREAGAVIIGKLVTQEFAFGSELPPTRNAWNASYYAGGSSAGAGAAVAVGSAFAALGTDAGGSVRMPAALNGVVGLKPTFGRLSTEGVIGSLPSLDHVGIVTRSVADCALMLDAMVTSNGDLAGGTDEFASALLQAEPESGARGMRLGVAGRWLDREIEPDVRRLVGVGLDQLAQLGATLVPVDVPSLGFCVEVGLTIFLAEAAAIHRHWLAKQLRDYRPETRRMLELGSLLPASHVEAAQRARSMICAEVETAFKSARLDVLVTPTLPRAAPPVDEMVPPVALHDFIGYTMPANLTGLPAISVPCGFAESGLPIGLQLIGRPFAEQTVLCIAGAYEKATSWHLCRPQFSPTASHQG
jgi:aspartyl-tRNA(Asn)/glutamyl-tRNA(Gln) amidotransferase subunit A